MGTGRSAKGDKDSCGISAAARRFSWLAGAKCGRRLTERSVAAYEVGGVQRHQAQGKRVNLRPYPPNWNRASVLFLWEASRQCGCAHLHNGAHNSKVGWKKRAEGVKVPKRTLCTFALR